MSQGRDPTKGAQAPVTNDLAVAPLDVEAGRITSGSESADPSVVLRADSRQIILTPSDICAVIVGRNESIRLPWFLEHYRHLGVTNFFFIDNESTDGTVDFLKSQPDVYLFNAPGSYLAARAGLDWSKYVLDTYCVGHWSLVVDVDELLCFPGCEQVSLAFLCTYLDQIGAEGLFSIMIDMYPRGPINSISYQPSEPFLNACSYFDCDGYYAVGVRQSPNLEIRGGPRERCFFNEHVKDVPPPPLKKVPLVKWQQDYAFTNSTHFIKPPIPLGDVSGALLHFKFLNKFVQHAKEEIERGERWNGGAQYRLYVRPLENDSSFTMYSPDSEHYEDSFSLLKHGLLRPSWRYVDFLKSTLGEVSYVQRLTEIMRARISNYSTELADVLALWPGVQELSAADREPSIPEKDKEASHISSISSEETPDLRGVCAPPRAGHIRGWALDRNHLERLITIDVALDGTHISTIDANEFREDLRNDGVGHGHYGFTFELPTMVWDGNPHEVSFAFASTGQQLKRSPISVTVDLLDDMAYDVLLAKIQKAERLLGAA